MVKQLGEKHNLPLKTAYNTTRGFYAQMNLNNRDVPVEDLPSQFIKVVKVKNVLAFTTADLVSILCDISAANSCITMKYNLCY